MHDGNGVDGGEACCYLLSACCINGDQHERVCVCVVVVRVLLMLRSADALSMDGCSTPGSVDALLLL
jgi:hypothetical protein